MDVIVAGPGRPGDLARWAKVSGPEWQARLDLAAGYGFATSTACPT